LTAIFKKNGCRVRFHVLTAASLLGYIAVHSR
jgi:hypothetical protein